MRISSRRLDGDDVHRRRLALRPRPAPEATISGYLRQLTPEARAATLAINAEALGLATRFTRIALAVPCTEHIAEPGRLCWDRRVNAVCGDRLSRGIEARWTP